MKIKLSLSAVFVLLNFGAFAQSNTDTSPFRQLGQELPTPNTYRSASGAPGHQYWQQKADYVIAVELNDDNQSIKGSETIAYTNNSPDELTYLWLQLDQNLWDKESDTYKTQTNKLDENASFRALSFMDQQQFDGGFKISAVKDKSGAKLRHTINKTMMRVDLPKPLKSKGVYSFVVEWNYNINDQARNFGRTGYGFFPEDGNYTYEIAQFFPRMAVYDDVNGWQHKQFLGQGEFALPFGDYKVSITVPADHIVAATGELQNTDMLTATQKSRLERAKGAKSPVLIVSQQEAEQAEKTKAKGKKTWVYAAKNVRDFAFASSRKFIWDAMQVDVAGKKVWAMSFYPKEGNPLWGQYSTEAVAHTLKVYSKHTIDYPYPVAISVHGAMRGGMEYPMICFNGGRPEKDGTYIARTKYSMITVIIHEVGHNFFPMIVNSDERQWSWMDEGLNSFVQYLAEQEWEKGYPSEAGEPYQITEYMKSDKSLQVPIMTNSESVLQFDANAYDKPATGLNMLRETILGRELFDYAFKEYSRRWAFKHPEPADFFRTMEDASGTDLDWFWRGWFYTTDHVDISLNNVTWMQINTQDPEIEKALARNQREKTPKTRSQIENEKSITRTLVDEKPELKDFYNNYDPLAATPQDKKRYEQYFGSLTEEEKKLLKSGLHSYSLEFENLGGLVMPLIIRMEMEDGTEKVERIPAEIWRMNDKKINKVLFTDKPVASFTLDPYLETADVDLSNNSFPKKNVPSRFQLYKQNQSGRPNPMQEAKEVESKAGTKPANSGK